MTFTKEQLDKMVWDADIANRAIIGEGVLSDVCCHVKALAAEVDRLQGIIRGSQNALDEIVISEGEDAGVILLSWDSSTYYDLEHKCQVYKHEHFSPLGDALVNLRCRLVM